MNIMEEVINELKIKIDDKNSEIENITKDKLEQEKVMHNFNQMVMATLKQRV